VSEPVLVAANEALSVEDSVLVEGPVSTPVVGTGEDFATVFEIVRDQK
jgi:hypothetical protein